MSAQHTPGVIAMLGSVDDHLQAIKHYGHGCTQREAMGIVQELIDALQVLLGAASDPGPMGTVYELSRAIPDARAAIAKAVQS